MTEITTPPGTTPNLNIPIPGAQANSKKLPDIQAVRAALLAIDSSLADLLGFSEEVTLDVIQTAINTAVDSIKDNVDVDGDTLAKLHTAITALQLDKVDWSLANLPNGFPVLGGDGKIGAGQLPSFVDDIIDIANFASLPAVGQSGKMYVTVDDNRVYRWSGTLYINVTSAGVNSVNGRTNVVVLTKEDVGLGNVDNTVDLDKPVSTAAAAAIASAQSTAIANASTDATSKANAAQAAAIAASALDATTKANSAQAVAIAASAPIAHVGSTGAAHGVASNSVDGFMSVSDKIKLDAVTGSNTGDETNATIKTKLGITTLSGVNTGDQTTITGNAGTATKLATARNINGVAFDGSADISINAVDSTARIASSEKGASNGVATLDGSGKVSSIQLPSFVDDVIESASLAALPAVGETGKIYITLDNNKTYRWSGSVYVYITSGAVDSVAGKTGVVTLVKADVGLSNVDNTSDANKPVSTAQQTAINTAQSNAIAAIATNNSATATKLLNARSIGMTGDMTWSIASFDGSANVTAAAVLANTAVTPGTYGSNANIPVVTVDSKGRITSISVQAVSIPSGSLNFTGDVTGNGNTGSSVALTLANTGVTAGSIVKPTVNAKGLVTGGSALLASDIPALDYTKITTGKPTSFAGLGLTESTTNLPEGTNQYFTTSRVLNTILAGLSVVTNAAVTVADSILAGIGKLQAQITYLFANKADLLLVKVRKTASWTLALVDSGRNIYFEGAGGYTLTVPKMTTVAIPQDTAITIINHTAVNMTVVFETGVSYYKNGNTTLLTATATLAPKSILTLLKTEDDIWYASGVAFY